MKIGLIFALLSGLMCCVVAFHIPSSKVLVSPLNRCLKKIKLADNEENVDINPLKLPLTGLLFTQTFVPANVACAADVNEGALQDSGVPSMDKINEALEGGKNALTEYGAAALKEGEKLLPNANSFSGGLVAHFVQLLTSFAVVFAWILVVTFIASKGIEFANWYFGWDVKSK